MRHTLVPILLGLLSVTVLAQVPTPPAPPVSPVPPVVVTPATPTIPAVDVAAPQLPTVERRMGLAKPLVMEPGREVYGAPLQNLKRVSLQTLNKERKPWNGKVVQVGGVITDVCPKKGCWMTVKEGEDTIRVKFTDYAFFMPLDAAGREVKAEGMVLVDVETEAERRHYAEDKGLPPAEIEKIKGDLVTVSFMADAVEIGKTPMPATPKAPVIPAIPLRPVPPAPPGGGGR